MRDIGATQTAASSCGHANAAPAPEQPKPASELVTMDVAKAIMVTVELDFGSKVPSIAQALTEVERRYQPDDGQGRTFAVLDAYGEPTPDQQAAYVNAREQRKAGAWLARFQTHGRGAVAGQNQPDFTTVQPKNLTVLMDNGKGTSLTVDGSANPNSIIDARVKPGDMSVRDIWPDGQEREFTFIYSACGCPVHVLAKRMGDKTMRV